MLSATTSFNVVFPVVFEFFDNQNLGGPLKADEAAKAELYIVLLGRLVIEDVFF